MYTANSRFTWKYPGQPADPVCSRVAGPTIRFLQDNIKQLGGNLGSHNIYCRRCTQRQAGGFDPKFGIQICANEMQDNAHLEDTLAHEMVHAYDHLRFKVDFVNNLRHAACAEVSFSFPAVAEFLGYLWWLTSWCADPRELTQR